MSKPTDITPNDDAREARPEELLLLDLLYGELDGDAEKEARSRLEGDEELARELETYGELRALLRELPEEEPPSAISAQLLHAAAEAAPKKRATAVALDGDGESGLWARILRFFQPLVASPSLAAATMLVLVAGVAGALYLGGKVKVSEPTVETHESAPGAATPAAPAALDDGEKAAGAKADPSSGEGRGATLSDELETDLGLDLNEEAEPDTEEAGSRTRKTEAPAEKERDLREGLNQDFKGKDAPAKPSPKRTRADSSSTTAPTSTGRVSGSAGGGGLIDSDDAAEGAAAESVEFESKPAERPPSVTTKPSGPSKKAPSKEPAPAPEPPPPPADQAPASAPSQDKSRADSPATLHQRAVLAAADGECDAVRNLTAQIQRIDSTYYAKQVRNDKRLAKCLSVPVKK